MISLYFMFGAKILIKKIMLLDLRIIIQNNSYLNRFPKYGVQSTTNDQNQIFLI